MFHGFLRYFVYGINYIKMTEMQEVRSRIEAAWDSRELLKDEATKKAILSLIESLDRMLLIPLA
jgi:hypothetical protein